MKKPIWKQVWEYGHKVHANRKYKDALFRMVFHDKKDLLDLYNAINHTNYSSPDELEITTIQDVIYMGMKNDLFFLIANDLNLYEHQSSYNPNMPLRGLFYFSDMLRAYVEENNLNIYGSSQLKLPVPVYLIFYNGSKNMPDQVELKLSDSFEGQKYGEVKDAGPALECRARMPRKNVKY